MNQVITTRSNRQELYQKTDFSKVQTPAFVVFAEQLQENLNILSGIKERTGCKILLALKGFALPAGFPLISRALDGVCASGYHEARLGAEEFEGQVHVYAPAFSEADVHNIAPLAHHLVFNSPGQCEALLQKFKTVNPDISFGLRVNPGHSEGGNPLYDPAQKGSRLGVSDRDLEFLPGGIEGLHFHSLCEMNADALERTLAAFENCFGRLLPALKWVNFGGGHHITSDTYDIELLVSLLTDFKNRYPELDVYLEPGEAVALGAGVLQATVLDIKRDADVVNVIVDASATCHTPDVLEVPYRPGVLGAGRAGENKYNYRIGGLSCLAGDVFGDYSFDEPLKVGSRVTFLDMAVYSMVKTNTFNGVPLPGIYYVNENGDLATLRKFGYEDFRSRL